MTVPAPPRDGLAWSKGAVRAILTNSRYTGHQIWNRQRKEEVLLDVEDVTLRHRTKLVWNNPDEWVWSTHPVHEPLIPSQRRRTSTTTKPSPPNRSSA
ncbi:hypothetical protein AQ490_13985 [Wenjunlia vitaminophila]|uniref:Recombinase domain-containing protein n=1 Tax=Wenjunlia vitaminophila TaxID=76728 RepID=A0A0T6LW56_WENVI|nr:recombinase family protein [Wenjunlia vitaminophila]KRV50225.1 hypothetical protein AQ490_13985 [Wenjunlia vitaminophila]